MIPSWMIEDIERWRREKEQLERSQARIEPPRPPMMDEGTMRRPVPSGRVVIVPGESDSHAPAASIVIDCASARQ